MTSGLPWKTRIGVITRFNRPGKHMSLKEKDVAGPLVQNEPLRRKPIHEFTL